MSTFTAPDTKLKELRPDSLSYVSVPAKETLETFICNTTAACYTPTAMEFPPFSMCDSGLPEQKLKEPRPDGLDYVLEDQKAAHTEDSGAAGGSLALSGPNSTGFVEHTGTAKGMATAQDFPHMHYEPVAVESSPVIVQNSETGCATVKPESTEATMIARIVPKSFTGLEICFLANFLTAQEKPIVHAEVTEVIRPPENCERPRGDRLARRSTSLLTQGSAPADHIHQLYLL
ncbi:uncharacterized protein EI90DRAFT_3135314 [Cantharellus anzutake]|uniref:uncharacterized protein n=1 Tax=Cantharellus anzutake TaxID=1750568 RepID=UPI0019032949|nr:uncharacterized protein EI90DRAFT_3135314 [Cantharellus anzutake]KAF8315277.1 hypothetical protein EI90DRAFT_3135314 [Cantharellus anzutake]